ncbi:MAG: restriction endonuclease [Candidatus Omnitrophota bacterium]|jgi:restriction system protein
MAYYEMWEVEVKHEGLNKYRLVRGRDRWVVGQTAAALKASWDEMWERKTKKEAAIKEKDDKKQTAIEKTKEAQDALTSIKNTLKHTLNINDKINWNSLLDESKYPKNKPKSPELFTMPIEPQKNDKEFTPKINFIISLFSSLKQKRIGEANCLFERAYSEWKIKKNSTEENNRKLLEKYEEESLKWQEEEKKYIVKREEKNKRILEKKEKYFRKDPAMIAEYCEMILSNSQYPDTFPQEFDVEYIPESKILLVDYFLPSIEDLPTLKEVKYNISQDQFKEIQISESDLNKLYDSLLYQITLRTMHELYEADVIDAVASIIFNGYVRFIDSGTGKEVCACILSIQVQREDFLNINLENIEPKACFKALKGIGSSKLHGLAPIAPIMKLNKEDKRFIVPYEVAGKIDEGTNIAAMDWQDFENLIRELFEKEFVPEGGEVKITRASRDEGVDAVIFDPDPIRGGKIVIQAKRYTNVVGVSAVRDLYGTVLNEGAMKGILVTTADYGPDSYKFAQDKPITLLNGNNLLHLLEKHGHKAKIDIREAKKILGKKVT